MEKYRKIAEKLLQEDSPISIEQLAVNTNLPVKEIELVLKEFDSAGFLKYKSNFNKVLLSEKARTKKS